MKSLFSVVIVCWTVVVSAQGFPYIGQPTISPQPATAGQPVRIITKTSTPNLGKSLYKNWIADATQKTVFIELCKWNGMLTAIQEYRDTFDIPSLAPGQWSVVISFSISSSDVACQTQTTSSATHTLQVNTVTTSIGENKLVLTQIYPNPASDWIFVKHASSDTFLNIYNALGAQVVANYRMTEVGLDISGLPAGVYVVRVATASGESASRLIVR